MTFEEIFSPGLRHWKEFKDWQADKIVEAPAAGTGPVTVDLDQGLVVIEEETEDENQVVSQPEESAP
ncbi:MAG: hypothetical protein FWD55_06510 [Propionibacteriaceae bacterium]|nr:hypothetical protein [Propionibacteriaceae bacterium]